MASQVQAFPEFVTQTRKYILINSDPHAIVHKASGISVTVPPRDGVLPFDKDNPTGFCSAKDVDGSYIPGTLVLVDRYKSDLEGNEVLSVDATLMVRQLLGIHNKQGLATSVLAQRGLSLLPAGMPRERLEEIREGGTKRSEKWRVEQARFIVAEFDNANAKRKKRNVPELTPDEDYTQALLLLRASRGKDQARLAAMLSGPDVTADPTLMAEIKQDVNVDEVDEILEMMKEKAREALPASAVANDINALVNQVLNSVEGMALMRKQFKMRKHARRQKVAAATAPPPTAADDQEVLEKIHGRPKPVEVQKQEAPLTAEDKAALLGEASVQAGKGALLEKMGAPE